MSTTNERCERTYALTPMQHGMLAATVADPESGVYVQQLCCALHEQLNVAAFRRAWQKLVERHAVFRTRFLFDMQDAWYQEVLDSFHVPLEEQDWRDLRPQQQELRLQEYLRADRRRGFEFVDKPPIRLALFRTGRADYQFVWTSHHALMDGRSRLLVVKELFTIYDALRQDQEPQLVRSTPYHEYIDWLSTTDARQAEVYWRDALRNLTTPTQVDFGRSREPGSDAVERFGNRSIRLSQYRTSDLRKLAAAHRVTLNNVLQGAWAILLSQFSGDACVAFGATRACRKTGPEGTESMVGLLINTLPLCVHVSPQQSLSNWLQQLRQQWTAMRDYEHTPLTDIQQWSDIAADKPLFESIMVFEKYELNAELQSQQGSWTNREFRRDQRSHYPITVTAYDGPELLLEIGFDRNHFDDATIDRVLGHLQTLLSEMSRSAEAKLSDFSLMSGDQCRQVLLTGNNTRSAFPRDACIYELFESQCEQSPDAVAVEFEYEHLTYHQLNAKANQLAWHLRSLGVGPETIVGVCLKRSLDMIVGLLGVLKAGGAYLPLDSTYPKERLAFMLQDASPRLLLTQQSTHAQLPDCAVPRLCLDVDGEQIAEQSCQNPVSGATADNLVYVMYTSGSTGQPKAVEVPNRGVSRLLFGSTYAQLDADQRILHMAPLSFDASTFEIWGPLLHGGRCVLFPDQIPSLKILESCLRDYKINTLWLTSSLFNSVVDESPEILTGIEQLLVGGESLSVPHIRHAVELLPHTRIVNGYGPTESTTFACCYRIPAEFGPHQKSIPVGRPIGNTTAYVLDATMHPVPMGAVGELYIGGDGLARGYLNRPELTAEWFVPHPFADKPGDRLYRTGDRVRWLSDGNLDFLGRADDQVKLRGFRVELGEIEAVLQSHPKVRTAVVLMREDRPGNKQLVAYVVPKVNAHPLPESLRRHATRKLPSYMIPAVFQLLDTLPLTRNGKLDRRALPAPGSGRSDSKEIHAEPRSPVDESLVSIWSDLLGTEQIGIHDNFFEIGGNSLLASRVVARIQRTLGVDLPLRSLFEFPTVAGLADCMGQSSNISMQHPLVAKSPRRGEKTPASCAQQRLWFLHQLNPASTSYHILSAVRIKGPLDVEVLERSLLEISRRHENLRTRFIDVHGRPYQLISQHPERGLDLIDLSQLAETLQASEIPRLVSQEARRPFDLRNGPLVRFTLLRLSEQHHIFLLGTHHIIFDGWSVSILFNELAQLYSAFSAGKESPLPELTIQYADYARWQWQCLAEGVLDDQLAYWTKQLAGAPPVLELPMDHPRPAIQGDNGVRHWLSLSPGDSAALEAACRQEEVTLFMALLAALNVLLSRQCGQTDVVVGVPIAGRQQPETETLIGMFVNTLVLRTDLSGAATFRELLRRVKEVTLAAYEHQDLPFEKLVEQLHPRRDLSRPTVVQVLVNVFNHDGLELDLPGLETERLSVPDPGSKFDLTLQARRRGEAMAFAFDYNADLFDEPTIARLAAEFDMIVRAFVADPSQRLSDLPKARKSSEAEVPLDPGKLQDPTVALDEPTFPLATSLIADWASHAPQQTAVSQDGRDWTYRELIDRAESLARSLIADGLRPGEVVAVTGQKSFGLIVSMVGSLRSGAVVLPIDPDLPMERQNFMVEEAASTKTVVVHDGDDCCENSSADVVLVNAMDGRLTGAPSDQNLQHVLLPELNPDDAAYVFFTSGSTGKPKGILGCHRGLNHFLNWQRCNFTIGPDDRVAQLTNLSFDVILRDVFLPLTSGAAVCLPPAGNGFQIDEVLPWLRRERITVVHTVPSLAELWLSIQQTKIRLPEMRWVFFAGEPLTAGLVERWRTTCSDVGQIVNLYGPTETTMVKCWYRVPADNLSGAQPIGRPLPQTQALVLDHQLRLCRAGEPGEIVLRTPFRTLGYLNDAEQNQRRFVKNPFRNDQRDWLYLTGDRGRYRDDGMLEFLGRLDDQVKIRGVRVEPGEVMAVLRQHPAVRSCFVTAAADEHDQDYLVAFVVAGKRDAITIAELRSFLGERLPGEMVPSKFVFLEHLPLTPNGKVDREALPSPASMHEGTQQTSVESMSPVEERLAAIWRQVLGLETISRRDDFFDLGGHSLLAMQLMSQIQKAFQIKLPLRQLFETPTVSDLARVIDNDSQPELMPAYTPASSTANKQTARAHLDSQDHAETNVKMADSAARPVPVHLGQQRHQPLAAWNDTKRCYPAGRCIHQEFEIQALRTPDAVAVVFEDQQLTYRQLNERSNQLARYLREFNVGPEVTVGLGLERSLELIVAMFGILKAGGAYLPLDLNSPPDRLSLQMDDANVHELITLERFASKLPDLCGKVFLLDAEWSDIAQNDTGNPVSRSSGNDAAYAIFTSGSSGRPKAVVVEHRQVLNYVQAVQERAGWDSPLSFALVQPLWVDASVTSIYPPVFSGGTLHVISEEHSLDPVSLAEYFERTRIDCLKIAPTHLAALQKWVEPHRLFPRHSLILGGEGLRWQWTDELRAMAPPECKIFNHYGPTEATVGVSMYRVDSLARVDDAATEQRSTLVPIGRPLANTQLYILDPGLQPVPVGVTGELYIGGDCVARGYLNRPEQTAQKFIAHPFDQQPGTRLYRTGDLALWRADGNIEFLGRADDQVKIRGFRIEPGEVESVLDQHPAVQESLVVACEDAAGDQRLVAYLMGSVQPQPSNAELREFVRHKLPEYMVPTAFVWLDVWPRTEHGKLDRRGLPAPELAQPVAQPDADPPCSALEKTIASLWCRLLKLDEARLEDNFFDVGGHSLLAIQLVSRLRETFQMALSVRVLFEAPTIAGLARVIVENEPRPGQADTIARAVQRIEEMSEEDAESELQQRITQHERRRRRI